MINRVEYLFAVSLAVADKAARQQGWHPNGRADWYKPDGTLVCFLGLAEQLAVVPHGATVHVVGERPAGIRQTCTVMLITA